MIALHLLAAVGATLILVRGTIFHRARRLYPPLLECSQCTGFWVGAVFGAVSPVGVSTRFDWATPLSQWSLHDRFSLVASVLVAGCAVSLSALFADAVLLKLLGDPHEP